MALDKYVYYYYYNYYILRCCLCQVGVVLLRCFVRKTVRTLNFDNPVYRKTTEDQVSLEKNQYQPTRSQLPSV